MTLFFGNFIDDRSNIHGNRKSDPMKTDTQQVFLQIVSVAVAQLKQRLQRDYEQVYPDLREIIHLVLDDEEANTWELSLFPHLLLPDLVAARLNNLNLHPWRRSMTTSLRRMASIESRPANRLSLYVANKNPKMKGIN